METPTKLESLETVRAGKIVRLFAILALSLTAWAQTTDVDHDETVILFPTYGRQSADARGWQVEIHAWIFELEDRKVELNRFCEAIGVERYWTHEEIVRFTDRAVPFLVDNERWQRITVSIAGELLRMPPSGADGHSRAVFEFPGEYRQARQAAANQVTDLECVAVLPRGDARRFAGTVLLIPPTGLSVISDLDDTIKRTEVGDARQVLRNTFLNAFEPIDGMAALYQQLARDYGAAFHYVSASPWQLYEPLHSFLDKSGFPEGTVQLQPFRVSTGRIDALTVDGREYKIKMIGGILADFPRRRFVLIGDTSQRDPEAFGELARRHPDQIAAIWIRQAASGAASDQRLTEAFRSVPRERWRVFRDEPAALLREFRP